MVNPGVFHIKPGLTLDSHWTDTGLTTNTGITKSLAGTDTNYPNGNTTGSYKAINLLSGEISSGPGG